MAAMTRLTSAARPATLISPAASPSTLLTAAPRQSTLLTAGPSQSTLLTAAPRQSTLLTAGPSQSTLLTAVPRQSTLLTAGHRQGALLTSGLRQGALLTSGPRQGALLALRPSPTVGSIRRFHSPSAPPELPSWVKEEVRKLVKEAVADETRGMKTICFERYDEVSTRLVSLTKEAATLHAETMMMHADIKRDLTKIALRVCISMGGLVVASPFIRDQSSGGGSGGGPPSREEVVDLVKQEVATTKEEVLHALAQDLQVIAAKSFLADQRRREAEKEQ